MTFVFEDMTDEQKEGMGFAKTREDAYASDVKYVDIWAIDREKDAKIVATSKGPYEMWTFEMHWQGTVTLIAAGALAGNYIPIGFREKEEARTGKYLQNIFKISNLVIPYERRDKLSEIKNMVIEGLSVFKRGMPDKGIISYAEFNPDLELNIAQQIKSEVKLSDSKKLQTDSIKLH